MLERLNIYISPLINDMKGLYNISMFAIEITLKIRFFSQLLAIFIES